jgi:outer membrane receptor protein involved in Fe transport
MGRTRRVTLLLASVSALALPSIATGQPAAPPPASAETVVVTGSRLITNGNDMPTPVTVVSTENLEALKPTNIVDGLLELPVFEGSRSQQSATITTGAAGAGAPASNQLNLRYFGANRTLILFDGQRVAPTTIANIVDVDSIPQMLIQRVDVVTGGVSAVYGSDAVIGVVNFVPDHNFDGVKLQAQAGESRYGDRQTWKTGIAAGTGLFDGKGHIEGSFQHYSDGGVISRLSRPYLQFSGSTGTGAQAVVNAAGVVTTPANPFVLLTNQPAPLLTNNSTFGGLITNGALKGQTFNSNGVLTPFTHGTATATPTTEVGGDGSYNDTSLVAPLRWDQVYGRFDYDFDDHVHGHIQAGLTHKFNRQYTGWTSLSNFVFSSTNAFLSPTIQAQLAAAKQTTFTMSERVAQAPEVLGDVSSNQGILNLGLDGDLYDYKWSIGLNYGRSALTDIFENNPNNQNLDAALDAVVGPNGQIVCYATTAAAGAAANANNQGCVPLNLFGPSAASADAISYAFKSNRYDATTKMYDANASISGNPFSTWAGPVGMALSAEWRRTTFASFTATPSLLTPNCAGLRFNCSSNQVLWVNAFGATPQIGVSVWETAAEFDAPLIKDVPFIQSLSINGGARYMSYSTSGDYTAWKVGFAWEVNDEVRFRGTASRDIRAPNLNELFAPAAVQPDNVQDLLTHTTQTVPSYRGGNPNLKAEIGETKTLGVVYRPDWLPGASLSVDAFDIVIANVLLEVKGDSTPSQTACYASGGSSTYCTLQTRPLGFTNTTAANAVQAWYQYYINAAATKSYGTDIEADYAGEIAGHRFSWRNLVTWQPHFLFIQQGVTNIDMGGAVAGLAVAATNPRLRVVSTESFNVTDDLRIDLTERGRSWLRLNGDTGLLTACCRIPAIIYLDLNVAYSIEGWNVAGYTLGQSELFFNMSNMLDKDPAPGSGIGYDDPVGRSFLAGVRLRL